MASEPPGNIPGGWSTAVRGDGNNSRPRQRGSSDSRILTDWRPCPRKGVQIRPHSWLLATASHWLQSKVPSNFMHSFVFLEPGRMIPVPISRDHRRCAGKLLLLLSGDVETNPGPVETRRQVNKSQEPSSRGPTLSKSKQQPKSKQTPTATRKSPANPKNKKLLESSCDWCKKAFRSNQMDAALPCSRKKCKRKVHRQPKCSFISKYDPEPVFYATSITPIH